MQWDISKSYVQLPGFSSPAVFNLIDLASEVQESLHCRICDRSVSANNWAWQRLESKAHAILNPDGIVQLGVKFRCIYCKAIHLAVPLPCHQGRGDGSVWASGDPAVDLVMRSLPSRNGFISKAVDRSRDITIKEAFDADTTAAAAKTGVKGDSSATWARPAPWVLYDRRGRSDQASKIAAAVPTDTLLGAVQRLGGGGGGVTNLSPFWRERHENSPYWGHICPSPWSNTMTSRQACRPCRGSCSPIPGRGCFGDLLGDKVVVPPPSPIVELLLASASASAATAPRAGACGNYANESTRRCHFRRRYRIRNFNFCQSYAYALRSRGTASRGERSIDHCALYAKRAGSTKQVPYVATLVAPIEPMPLCLFTILVVGGGYRPEVFRRS